MCPKCSKLMRLSDLQLHYRGKTQKTWLDTYERKIKKIEDHENDFSEKESMIREKAVERGRKKVPKLIQKSMDDKFAKLNYDPYDIKPVLHPIDFLVFDGMNKKKLNEIILLSRKTTHSVMLNLQKSVTNVIKNKLYDWKVARVSIDGQIQYE